MTPTDRRPRWWAGWIAVAILAIYGVWQIGSATGPAAGGPPELPAPAAVSSSAPVAPLAVAPTAVAARLSADRSVPTKIVIKSIGLRAGIGSIGLRPNGSLETPSHELRNRAMWYRSGPTPGEIGPSVIVGHVDSKGLVAVFFYLTRMRPGDKIEVTRQDGKVAVFTVGSIEKFAKSAFPTDRIYGPTDGSELRLITCGGTFDRARATWNANIVVFAQLTEIRKA